MTIVKGITESYAHRLSRDLDKELRRMVEEGVFSVTSSDYFLTEYQNSKPSVIEEAPDGDYVYITDTANDINNYYKITPE
jgi:hypothetical protein